MIAFLFLTMMPMSDEMLVERAIDGCPRWGDTRPEVDPWVLLDLLHVEDLSGIVPINRRGVTIAAWCLEAGYNRTPEAGDGGDAVGPLQMHVEHASWCGLTNRMDLVGEAACWLARVDAIMPRAAKTCPHHAFDVAEAMVSSPLYAWECWAKSSHTRLARTWHR